MMTTKLMCAGQRLRKSVVWFAGGMDFDGRCAGSREDLRRGDCEREDVGDVSYMEISDILQPS